MTQTDNIQSILKRHPEVSLKRAQELVSSLAHQTTASRLYALKIFKENKMPDAEIVFVEELIGVRDPLPEPKPESKAEPESEPKTKKRSAK